MAQQSGGKGNPASHRMSNTNLAAKRKRSWERGEKRKKRNREANEARAKANAEALAALGGKQQTYERVTERDVRDPKTGLMVTKTFTRTKLESPGTALARTKRGA
jgi:hypothetical protein